MARTGSGDPIEPGRLAVMTLALMDRDASWEEWDATAPYDDAVRVLLRAALKDAHALIEEYHSGAKRSEPEIKLCHAFRVAKAAARVQTAALRRVLEKRKQVSAPPRYDEVYEQGAAWLDAIARGDICEECGGERVDTNGLSEHECTCGG